MNAAGRSPAPMPEPCILVGPTASGKSSQALRLAQALAPAHRIELISIDSAQVYRGLDIGTAKPGAAERAAVPHHGLDLIEPTESYSAARFVEDARRSIADVQSRGGWPWLVGGTMLYVKALREGLDELPPASPAVRAALDAEAAARGVPALHAELQRHDPVTAARLHPTDSQRIQRALEVVRTTGRPLSDWQGRAPRDGWALPMVSLEPVSRAWLHARIAERFDAMLADGLLDEVHALRQRGDLHPGLPSVRCVGYRQLWAALDASPDGLPPAAGSPAWRALRDAGIAATRQLAKRQLTWLRSMPQRQVLPADDPQVFERLHAWALQQAAR